LNKNAEPVITGFSPTLGVLAAQTELTGNFQTTIQESHDKHQ